ncbi:MAG: monovalent cation/H+ antiporter complex subunit F [Oscillospiraceae bacterium]|nr:monovalent cation/H+ antiporter complex subunit F [Oscillospiraceae bacterium]
MIEIVGFLRYLLLAGMAVLGMLIALCLIRAVIGPRLSDRIVAVNLICTLVVIFLCFLALYLAESFLIDIAILYALLNLVAVSILTRVVIHHKRLKHENPESKEDAT